MLGTWEDVGYWLLRCALGGGLLLLLSWVALFCCRQPAHRQRLGEWGTAAAVLLALLSLAPPWLVLPLLDPMPAPAEADAPGFIEDLDEAPTELIAEAAWLPDEGDGSDRLVVQPLPYEGGGVAGASHSREGEILSGGSLSWPSLTAVLSGGYLAIASLLAARWLLGYVTLRRLLRSAHPAPHAVVQLFVAMVPGPRPPRLLVSPRVRVPFSCGLLWPTIVLPATLCERHAVQALRWVFAHELTHLQRRDAWGCLLFGLGQAVYFYVPWFWGLRRQVRLCQEYIADAAAVEQAASAEDYAAFLLRLTTLPAVPVSATGVLAHSSDLFRRVTMLLQSPQPVQRGCPCWWSLAAAGILLTLGIVGSGISLCAQEEPAAAAEDTKLLLGDPLAAPDSEGIPAFVKTPIPTAVPDVEQLLRNLPKDLDPEKVKELRQALTKAREQMLQAMQEVDKVRAQALRQKAAAEAEKQPETRRRYVIQLRDAALRLQPNAGRLGVAVEAPSAILADQLDLTAQEGLVVTEVLPGSPAAKAGVKVNDILLQVGGKPVAREAPKLIKVLQEVKPSTSIEIVVLRKGKRLTIRGVVLAAPKPEVLYIRKPTALEVSTQPALPGFSTSRSVMTTTFRTDDRFTTRHQEGSLIITLTGTVAEGKAKLSDIHVQDGNVSKKYESVDQVPEQYRDKVKNLIELSEKSGGKIEIKKGPGASRIPSPNEEHLELELKLPLAQPQPHLELKLPWRPKSKETDRLFTPVLDRKVLDPTLYDKNERK